MKLFSGTLLKELSNGTRRCKALYLRAAPGKPKPKNLYVGWSILSRILSRPCLIRHKNIRSLSFPKPNKMGPRARSLDEF